MRKFTATVLTLGLLASAGCTTLRIEAPEGQTIQLQSQADIRPVVSKSKAWFALWGLVPLTDVSTANIVKNMNLKEMSCITYFGLDDVLISAILSTVTVICESVEIHGQ